MFRQSAPLTALILVVGAIALSVIFLFASAGRTGYVPELDNPNVLRVYAVPASRADDIRVALSHALAGGGKDRPSRGLVTLSGTNQLVVMAPLGTHSSIQQAIERLGGGKDPAAGSDASVRLTVWIVDAQAGAGADDAALAGHAGLAGALDAARAALGPVQFRLYDTVSITSIPNGMSAGIVSGRMTSVTARLRPVDGGVQAQLDARGGRVGSLETTAALPFGKTIVLAQLAAPGEAGADATVGERPTRLYVVRAEPAAGG